MTMRKWQKEGETPTGRRAEKAIEKYLATSDGTSENIESKRRIAKQIVDAIENKDVETLRNWINGINPNINRLFTDITGLPSKLQREADISIRSLNPETWDKWQADKEATKKGRQDAINQKSMFIALQDKVNHKGNIKTKQQFIDDIINDGYTTYEEKKRGIINVGQLSKGNSSYRFKTKAEKDYIKQKIEGLSEKQSLGGN